VFLVLVHLRDCTVRSIVLFSWVSSSLKLLLDDQALQKFGISYVSKINLKELLSCRKLKAARLSTF
jgi:hypothetical protein